MKFQNKSIFDYFPKVNNIKSFSIKSESDYDINCNSSILQEVKLLIKDKNNKSQSGREQKTISFNPIFTVNSNLSKLIQSNQVLNRKIHRSVSSHNIFLITKVNKHKSVSNTITCNYIEESLCPNTIYLHVPKLTCNKDKND
jgi:hypothetical protein